MITLSILLIPYGIFLLIYGVAALFNLYHVFKFSFGDKKIFASTFFFISVSVVIIFLTYQSFMLVDWSTPILNFTGNFSDLNSR